MAIIRLLVIACHILESKYNVESNKRRKLIHFFVHIVFILMNIILITPIVSMIKDKRKVSIGLVGSIAMAGYTIYKIVNLIINRKKNKNSENILFKDLYTLNVVDSLVSVLTLQNTMIVVNQGSVNGSMLILIVISSTAIWLIIVVVSIHSFVSSDKIIQIK